MAMEGYDPKKEYVVAKHSDKFMMLRKGRVRAGEIPDASGDQDGTMVVWEILSKDPQVVAEPEPVETVTVTVATPTEPEVVEPPTPEPPKPTRITRAIKKVTGKKGTK